jgi:F-type H+-transporting ATPase subunit alpha
VEAQTVSIWAGTKGLLDIVPVSDILRFESEFLDYLRREHSQILQTIRETLDFTDDTEEALRSAYDKFLDQFETGEGRSLKAGHEEFDALPDEDVEQEQIVKQKRA